MPCFYQASSLSLSLSLFLPAKRKRIRHRLRFRVFDAALLRRDNRPRFRLHQSGHHRPIYGFGFQENASQWLQVLGSQEIFPDTRVLPIVARGSCAEKIKSQINFFLVFIGQTWKGHLISCLSSLDTSASHSFEAAPLSRNQRTLPFCGLTIVEGSSGQGSGDWTIFWKFYWNGSEVEAKTAPGWEREREKRERKWENERINLKNE